MGRRGPAPQPTQLKVSRGNPGKRALNEHEPVFAPPSTREPPAELVGLARETWEKFAGMLIDSGVLTEPDLPGFATYCKLMKDEREWEEMQAKAYGLDDRKKVSDQLIKIRTAQRAYADRYGLNPSSRSQVKAKKPTDPAQSRREKFGLIGGKPA